MTNRLLSRGLILFLSLAGAYRLIASEMQTRQNIYSHTVIRKVGVIEFDFANPDGKTEVVNSFLSDITAAQKAGLKSGDVIVSFDGKPLISREALADFYDHVYDSPNRKIKLIVDSGGKEKHISFQIPERDLLAENQDIEALIRLLYVGKTVNLAVIVNRIKYIAPASDKKALKQWEKRMKDRLLSTTEERYSNFLSHNNHFHLIDKELTNKLLTEHKFQLSEPVLPRDIKRLGSLAGASYLAFVGMATDSPGSSGHFEIVTTRIVSVETGTDVASASASVTY